MKAGEKKCPRCAEAIKREAIVCKHCGHEFDPAAVKAEMAQDTKNKVIGVAILVGIILLIGMCSSGGGGGGATTNTQNSVAALEAKAAQEAEERRKGFHCLSAWDGSHSGLVQTLKEGLRDPDSFEHDETRITPVNDKGEHSLTMKYRARNGFGGMNRNVLVATVRNSDCSGTIISTGD